MSTRPVDYLRRAQRVPEEVAFEMSEDARDQMRLEQMQQMKQKEEDLEYEIQPTSWPLQIKASKAKKKAHAGERSDSRGESAESYEYEVRYDESSHSSSTKARPEPKFLTSAAGPNSIKGISKQISNAGMRSTDNRSPEIKNLYEPMIAHTQELRRTPAYNPVRAKKPKKSREAKQSFQMQAMMDKLSQLKEMEKQSKNLKTQVLQKGINSARKFEIADKKQNPPAKQSFNTSQKVQALNVTRPSSSFAGKLRHAKSGNILEATKSKRPKSKSRLDKTLNDYLKQSTSQIIREPVESHPIRSSSRRLANNSRSRSAARMHPRLCELQSEMEKIENLQVRRKSIRSRQDKLQSYRSSRSRSQKSKVSGKSGPRVVFDLPKNSNPEFQSNTCIEMFANQQIRGGMSFGVDMQKCNTENCSRQLTRNVTPEHFKLDQSSNSKPISQYKSNQKDSKIPDLSDLQVTSRTMQLEELGIQDKKDSAHHDSKQSLLFQYVPSKQASIQVEVVEETVIKQDLAQFFENEFKGCQKELLQAKSQLYEARYKVDLLKRRLDEAEQVANECQAETSGLRAQIQEIEAKQNESAQSLQIDSSQCILPGQEKRLELEQIKYQFQKMAEESQTEVKTYERAIMMVNEEQSADLKHQRMFIKSIVQQISQVESFISQQPDSSLPRTSHEEEPIVSAVRGDTKMQTFLGLSSTAARQDFANAQAEQEQFELQREKSARLACMFNSIYKTLKNLNDELIAKKKKLQARKKQMKLNQSRRLQEKELEKMDLLKNLSTEKINKFREWFSEETGVQTENSQETPRESTNDFRPAQKMQIDDARVRRKPSIELIEKTEKETPGHFSNMPMSIKLNYQVSGSAASMSEIMTPVMGSEAVGSNRSQTEGYGVLLNQIQAFQTQSQIYQSNEQKSVQNEQYLLSMVNKLQADLENVKSQSTQLLQVNATLQHQNAQLQSQNQSQQSSQKDNEMTRLQEENNQLAGLVNGLRMQQKNQDLMIQYLQGTQNSILQKLQHQAIKTQFTTSLAESAAIANSFFQHQTNSSAKPFANEEQFQSVTNGQTSHVGSALTKSEQLENMCGDVSVSLNEFVQMKSSKAKAQNAERTTITDPQTLESKQIREYDVQSDKMPRKSCLTRQQAYNESHQNARRQYFVEEGKPASQSLGGNNSASSMRSNNTKLNDISIISMNQLHPQAMMPDQMRRLMKHTESQGVSDDGHEGKSNPYQLTGQFENKAMELFRNFGSDIDGDVCEDEERLEVNLTNEKLKTDQFSNENGELVCSPVIRNLEALEQMNEYNSHQIMMLVNQMKSASVSQSGQRTKSDLCQSVNSGTYDEDTIAMLLKQNGQLPSQFLMQEKDSRAYQSKTNLTGVNSEPFATRLLRSSKQESMSQSDIQDLTPSDNAFTASMVARELQLNDLQRRIQSINQKAEITDFEAYGAMQSKLGSNRILSVSDQNLIHNLQETEGPDSRENSQILFQPQVNSIQAKQSQQLLGQIKSPEFNQVETFDAGFISHQYLRNESSCISREEVLTSQEGIVSANINTDFQLMPETSSRNTTPALSRIDHHIAYHQRDESQPPSAFTTEQRINLQAQYIRELEQMLTLNGYIPTQNETAFHNRSYNAHSYCSDINPRKNGQSQNCYMQLRGDMANSSCMTSFQQLPMPEINQINDYQDNSSMMTDNMLQSTELAGRRKSNYSPFSTVQGTGRSALILRSRSNSPHDTSLAASSDRIEKRTKKMKKQIQSIDAEIQQMLQQQFKN